MEPVKLHDLLVPPLPEAMQKEPMIAPTWNTVRVVLAPTAPLNVKSMPPVVSSTPASVACEGPASEPLPPFVLLHARRHEARPRTTSARDVMP